MSEVVLSPDAAVHSQSAAREASRTSVRSARNRSRSQRRRSLFDRIIGFLADGRVAAAERSLLESDPRVRAELLALRARLGL